MALDVHNTKEKAAGEKKSKEIKGGKKNRKN